MFQLTTKWVSHALHKRLCGRTVRGYSSGHNVLFFGSDKFSLPSLKALYSNSSLCEENRNDSQASAVGKLSVVTSLKGTDNAVQKFAAQTGIPLHDWPIANPRELCRPFDIGIVVSFGHLIPETIISSFPLGMINVHASLLPKWRGAAPVIYAILNGDQTTGVSIMKIRPKHFDIGEVLAQKEVPIHPHMLMPELHHQLSQHGAALLLDSVRHLPDSLDRAQPQEASDVQYAPKVTPALAEINWKGMTALQVYNRYRALYSYKHLTTNWQGVQVKLVEIRLPGDDMAQTASGVDRRKHPAGHVHYDRSKKELRVLCADGQSIVVDRIGVTGKRIMSSADFYNGFMQKTAQGSCFV